MARHRVHDDGPKLLRCSVAIKWSTDTRDLFMNWGKLLEICQRGRMRTYTMNGEHRNEGESIREGP
jgi:hypothetical protein